MSRRSSPSTPPRALMVTLMLCLTALLLGYLTYPGSSQNPVAVEPSAVVPSVASPLPSVETPRPTPVATPVVSPTETPQEVPDVSALPDSSGPVSPAASGEPISPPVLPAEIDYSSAVPQGDAADGETWFQDAVFIGDSRTDGFHLYSGVKGGTYLVHTGLTVFDVNAGKAVLGSGEDKYSVLSALKQKQYGKVYLALGVNELGWFDAEAYAEAFGKLIDSIRSCQTDAVIYVQAIVPVNSEVCKAHKQPYYVTNENITSYNAALAALCAEKEVLFVNISEVLVDPETGELPADMTHDGVHFKKEGYQAWLSYLLCHTGESSSAEALPEETPEPTPEPTPTPMPEMPPEAPEATPGPTDGPVG